jgi:arsenical pump membrane protein
MYTIIYGLNNIGLTNWLVKVVDPLVSGGMLHASMLMGILLTVMSNLFNNHPALMVGTITLMHMHLDLLSLKIAYLASIVGSDMGSLILPMGTLASLMWMYIVRRGNVQINWSLYIKTTIVVIPPTVLVTLLILYSWVSTFFGGVLIR